MINHDTIHSKRYMIHTLNYNYINAEVLPFDAHTFERHFHVK